MPNHVDNVLSVIGDPDAVAEFVAKARGKPPRPGDPPDSVNHTTQEQWDAAPEQPLCFHALVPLPAEYSERPYDPFGYDAERAAWGVKWGPYHGGDAWIPPVADPGIVTYEFQTAWGPPVTLLETVAENWPGLSLLLSYAGEGPVRGRFLYAGGVDVWGVADDYPTLQAEYPPRPGDEDDDPGDAYYEACAVVDQRYTRTHTLWAALYVARRGGRAFPADAFPVLSDWLRERGCERLADAVLALPPGTDVSPTGFDDL